MKAVLILSAVFFYNKLLFKDYINAPSENVTSEVTGRKLRIAGQLSDGRDGASRILCSGASAQGCVQDEEAVVPIHDRHFRK